MGEAIPSSSAMAVVGPLLGIVGISKNEERDMPAFLGHLLPWVDEIVIVDDGSTDRTVEIVQQAGAKVKLIRHPMDPEQGFAGQRNAGIAAATSDWLLHMDIDERVPPELAREIVQAIQDPSKDAYCYRRLNFFLHRPMKGRGWNMWNNPQLARRGKHRFEKPIHESCVVDAPPERIGQLQNMMWHLNDVDYVERMRKSFHYSELEARKILQQGVKVRWYHLIAMPARTFLREFFPYQGYVDGVLGLLFALHYADAVFRAYALAWDEQNRISRGDFEQQLLSGSRVKL